jgi:hypothetical protein
LLCLDEVATRAGGFRLGEVGGQVEGAAHEGAAARRESPPMAIAVARCDLLTPGGPIRSTPLCVSTKRALANSTIFALGIFALKVQSKSASVFSTLMPVCFSRRAKSRVGAPGELVLDEQFEKLKMRQWRGFGLRRRRGGSPDATARRTQSVWPLLELLMLQRCGGLRGAEPLVLRLRLRLLDVAFFEHGQDVVFTHDEVFVPIELDLLAGVLAEQNAVAPLARRAGRAYHRLWSCHYPPATTLPCCGFSFAVSGNNDPADFLFAFVDALNKDAVV